MPITAKKKRPTTVTQQKPITLPAGLPAALRLAPYFKCKRAKIPAALHPLLDKIDPNGLWDYVVISERRNLADQYDRARGPNPVAAPFSVVRSYRPKILSKEELTALTEASAGSVDGHFVMACRLAVDAFVALRDSLRGLRANAVRDRLKRVFDAGVDFLRAVNALEVNERLLIGKHANARFVAGQKAFQENEVANAVKRYLVDVRTEVDAARSRAGKAGRTTDYAARQLAVDVQSALHIRDGKLPPLTRGGEFERLLKWALDVGAARAGSSNRPRRDVMPLMRFARSAWEYDDEANESSKKGATARWPKHIAEPVKIEKRAERRRRMK